MSVYPGTPQPEVDTVSSLAESGYVERKIRLTSHTGTHIDAPAHMIPDGQALDSFPLDRLVGPGYKLDVSRLGAPTVELRHLMPYGDEMRLADFLLLQTGWSRLWGSPSYFRGYPVLTAEAARWLTSLGLSGLGVDAASPDAYESDEYLIHHILLSCGIVIVENLTNLAQVPTTGFTFVALPIRLEGADGAPARAIAILD
jgi:kynurenine formamidase